MKWVVIEASVTLESFSQICVSDIFLPLSSLSLSLILTTSFLSPSFYPFSLSLSKIVWNNNFSEMQKTTFCLKFAFGKRFKHVKLRLSVSVKERWESKKKEEKARRKMGKKRGKKVWILSRWISSEQLDYVHNNFDLVLHSPKQSSFALKMCLVHLMTWS